MYECHQILKRIWPNFQILFVFFLPIFLVFILPCIVITRCRHQSSNGNVVKIIDSKQDDDNDVDADGDDGDDEDIPLNDDKNVSLMSAQKPPKDCQKNTLENNSVSFRSDESYLKYMLRFALKHTWPVFNVINTFGKSRNFPFRPYLKCQK